MVTLSTYCLCTTDAEIISINLKQRWQAMAIIFLCCEMYKNVEKRSKSPLDIVMWLLCLSIFLSGFFSCFWAFEVSWSITTMPKLLSCCWVHVPFLSSSFSLSPYKGERGLMSLEDDVFDTSMGDRNSARQLPLSEQDLKGPFESLSLSDDNVFRRWVTPTCPHIIY